MPLAVFVTVRRLTSRLVVPSPVGVALLAVIHGAIAAIGLLATAEHDRGRTRACLDALAATWSHLRTIDAVLAPGVTEALDADPDADEAVAEVLAEATNNAIRHGDARTVTIRIDWTDETAGSPGTLAALVVRVEDDGTGWDGDPAPGMGTRTFDELFARWERARTAGGTVVTGSVPVDLRDPASAAPSA